MTTREKILQASFSNGFEDAIMLSIQKVVTLSGTLISFSRWWIAASLILTLVSGLYLRTTLDDSQEDLLSHESRYNYILYTEMGDLL